MGKIVSKEEFSHIREQLKKDGKTVAQCHGVFDLVHPGHVQHFKEAKAMADVLVVSVTAAKYVRKGPGRPYFSDEVRQFFIASIEYVDYVMLSEGYTGEDVIEVVKPNYWVKGEEYRDRQNDTTKVQDKEVALVRSFGGDIRFTGGIRFSSSYILNKTFAAFSEELTGYLVRFKENFSLSDAESVLDRMKNIRILVIGDVIVDEYIYCTPPGEMSKAIGYSTSVLRKERSLGGSLAIARHAAAFSDKVDILAVIGNEKEVAEEISCEMEEHIGNKLVVSEEYDTIIKSKYIVENKKREELNKIFSVNNIKSPAIIPEKARKLFLDYLEMSTEQYDVVIVCDYGHGLVDRETIGLVEKKAKYLAVNCQTNATNYGMNPITKYQGIDSFSLDQRELKIAMRNEYAHEEEGLIRLKDILQAKTGWLTRGSQGAYGVEKEVVSCPAVSTRVKDTIGAGDAFFVMAALADYVGESIETSTFLGNVAGAIGANIVGNSKALNRNDVLKFIATLLAV